MALHISIEQPTRIYAPEFANRIVEQLNADDEDDWVYAIEEIPANLKGYVRIAITDEDGEFVTYFNA